jgi:hypothetical protein
LASAAIAAGQQAADLLAVNEASTVLLQHPPSVALVNLIVEHSPAEQAALSEAEHALASLLQQPPSFALVNLTAGQLPSEQAALSEAEHAFATLLQHSPPSLALVTFAFALPAGQHALLESDARLTAADSLQHLPDSALVSLLQPPAGHAPSDAKLALTVPGQHPGVPTSLLVNLASEQPPVGQPGEVAVNLAPEQQAETGPGLSFLFALRSESAEAQL